MKTYVRFLLLTTTIFLVIGAMSLSANAQLGTTAKRGDVRVQRVLDTLKLRYEVQTSGNFKLVPIDVGNKRTQLAYIDSATDVYENLDIREVWAPAAAFRGQLSAATANKLLQQKPKFGGWRVYYDGTNSLIYFAVHISADSDAETVKTALQIVTRAADTMELELTSKDDF